MGSTELVVASRAVAVRDYPPLPGPAGERGALLIRAAGRAGEARRTVSRLVHDMRYRPPRRRTAKMLVLIPAHNEEATIGKNLHALLVPVEIYLVVRIACATASWANVVAGIKRDGWASQARAEQAASNGPVKMLGALLLVGLLGAGAVFGRLHAPLFIQQRTLTVGWGVLAVVTALQTLVMVLRVFPPSRGLRP